MDVSTEPSVVNQTLKSAAYFIFITQIYFCSMYAVVLWDWVISIPREYKWIWKSPWTPVKFSYLFCRYWVICIVPYLLFCFVVDHPLEVCQKIYFIPVTFALWNQVGSESILLIRTYAFFNRSVPVLMFLLACLFGVVAYQLYVATSQMLLLPFVTPPFTHGPCLPVSKPHSAHLLGFFIAPLMFDTLVTMMTVYKAIKIRRNNGGAPMSGLIQTFLAEGVFYYILISCANLVNGVFYLQPRQAISAINIPLSVMMGPLLACRLILDLRQRGSEESEGRDETDIAFTMKSGTQPGSPFTPPTHRSKGGRLNTRHNIQSRGLMRTMNSNVLTTIGTIPVRDYYNEGSSDSEFEIQRELELEEERERDKIELDEIKSGLGMTRRKGMEIEIDTRNSNTLRESVSNGTIVIGEDGKRVLEEGIDMGKCEPKYHDSGLEMGFKAAPRVPSIDEDDDEARIQYAMERARQNTIELQANLKQDANLNV